jgi:hypothetical protein
MIRLTTDADLAAKRKAMAEQFAEVIEAMPVEACTHQYWKSCPKCATRLAVQEAARMVREAGGIS